MPVTRKLLLSAVILIDALLVYFALTRRFPISGDDYSYLYQAKLFASGKLYATDPVYDRMNPFHGCIATNCLTDDLGHRFSKYPPGWPLLLAAGVKLGPFWLVDPLLGALLVLLMLEFVERRMGKELVKVTWLLLALCFFFFCYAASFRAHTATALFVFGAFLAYDRAERRPHQSIPWLFIAGTLLGYSSMIRYTDWIPLAIWIGVSLLRRKRFASLILFGVGFALLASGNLLYDALLSGHPFRNPGVFHGARGFSDRLEISWTGFWVTGVRLANLLWAFPPALLLVVLWRRYQASSKMYLALFLLNVAIYFFYPQATGGPGPRYFLSYFPFLVLAVVDLYRWIRHDGPPVARRLWKIAIIGQIVCSIGFATEEAYTLYWRRDLERTAQHAGGSGKKIFLLKTGTFMTHAGDLTRNPPVLSSADTLYFRLCNEPERDEFLSRFPGRKIFIYEYPGRLYPYVPTSNNDP